MSSPTGVTFTPKMGNFEMVSVAKAEILWTNVGIKFALDLMRWQRFCNSAILYYNCDDCNYNHC